MMMCLPLLKVDVNLSTITSHWGNSMYTTLIDPATLSQHLNDPDWIIVDCRFDLANSGWGRQEYLQSHIPGAVYAHLNQDLSGPPLTNQGRHPLPVAAALADLFSRLGIDNRKQVVVYDSMSGSICARLWWLLRYMGHAAVAALDGGWQAWTKANLPIRGGIENYPPAKFQGQPNHDWIVTVDAVPTQALLIDSRDPLRYRGEVEPIDPIAGHIPGAVNHFWKLNLDVEGNYLPADRLKASLQQRYGQVPAEQAVFYCGSGVTACHNLLAAVHAGLPMPRLYAGSWSEWCRDPARQVEVGEGV
jgi:thiosulfate/3-mercaptopyruvate sulfurtransferase